MATATKKSVRESEKQEAIARLREWLKPRDTVYCILRSVSRSGMSRVISFIQIDSNVERAQHGRVSNSLKTLDYNIGIALDYKRTEHGDGLKVSGCGMDMGFHIVYNLGRVLFPDGFAPSEIGIRPLDGKRVNVNIGRGRNAGPMTRAEMAELATKGWKFEDGRNGNTSGWDTDGGYALSARWL